MTTFAPKAGLLGALLLFLFSAVAPAADIDARLKQAGTMMEEGRFTEAYEYLNDLITADIDSVKEPACRYYLGKAAYYAGKLDKGREHLEILAARFPQSSYVPYALFLTGNIHYRRGDDYRALEAYLDGLRLSPDTNLDNLILKAVTAAAALPHSRVIEKISIASVPESKRCRLAMSLARVLLRQGNHQKVLEYLEGCPGMDAVLLRNEAIRQARQELPIGIALPLSGEWQKYGEAVLDGIMLMAEQFGRSASIKLTPIVYDTKGESVEAARIIHRLNAQGVAAVIGPLTSEESAVASASLFSENLPLLAPAASQSGLTELSASSFQLRPGLEHQGERMAQLAVQYLKFDTAVVLTPTSPENLRIARAFTRHFRELGGTVLGIEYFRGRETDFGPVLLDIKSMVLGDLSDSLIFINENGDTLEPREIPAHIECLYIPAETPQLTQLLPQIDFYNIKTTFLGGDGWGDRSVYNLGREVLKTCYFSSVRIADTENRTAQLFASAFKMKYGNESGFLEALGYDALGLVTKAAAAGHVTRRDITRFLQDLKDFKGASGEISFGGKRENQIVPIYTIDSGKPIRVRF